AVLMRSTFAAACAIAMLGAMSLAARAPAASGALRFTISFPAALSAEPLDGRVLLFVSDDGKSEPKSQSGQYRANPTRPIFGIDIDGPRPDDAAGIDERTFCATAR